MGFTPLIISFLIKLTPERWAEKLNIGKVIDEDKNVDNNKLLAGFNKVNDIKVGKDSSPAEMKSMEIK